MPAMAKKRVCSHAVGPHLEVSEVGPERCRASDVRNLTRVGWLSGSTGRMIMKIGAIALAAAFALCGTFAYAQGNASGAGSTTGDPAASSQNTRTDTSGMSGSKSGSGSSTSGGRDDTGDQGRDKMPDSNKSVRPYDQQNKPPK
jgi:hypothetical protein